MSYLMDTPMEAYDAGCISRDAEIAVLREQVKVLQIAVEKFRQAIGDHHAPDDCYATGPLTGNAVIDLIQCPACSAIAAYEAATKPKP